MITKYYPNKLSAYCKKVFGCTLGGKFKKFNKVYVEYSCISGIPLYLVTPFSCTCIDMVSRDGVFPYCYSSDNLSDILEFFKHRYPSSKFNFIVYER